MTAMSKGFSTTSCEEVDGKKRQVWRSSGSTTANNNNNMMMSPEAAANYLQQAAQAAATAAAVAATATASGSEDGNHNGGIGGRGESVKITLGPNGISARTTNSQGKESFHWLSPHRNSTRAGSSYSHSTSSNSACATSNQSNTSSRGGNPVSVSNLDLAALAKAGDLSALTSAAITGVNPLEVHQTLNNTVSSLPKTTTAINNNNHNHNQHSNKDSLPCSEAEMKALMSMFVEIMGMSLDTEKLGKSTAKSKKMKGSSFMDKNGWPDPAIAAATGDLDALNALGGGVDDNGDDDDDDDDDDSQDDDDSLPDLEEINKEQVLGTTNGEHISSSGMPTNLRSDATPVTGRAGISPVDWESLEQVAIEDAMEAEERARKAAKRREKKSRKKEKARKEAATKAAEEAAKMREKSILSWRNKVISACQSNEVSKLESLLQESPLKEDNSAPITMATMTPHLEFLLPQTVAKNRNVAERGKETRTILAHYLMDVNLPLIFITPLRSGRPALHTACLYAEQDFVQYAVQLAQSWSQQELSVLPSAFLETTCQESGFAPLHYAVLSGSRDLLELLLEAGADVTLKSNDTHTWRTGNGKGISARELADVMAKETEDRLLETHGLAIQEALSYFSSKSDRRKFRKILDRMVERLKSVEQHGYSPWSLESDSEESEEEQTKLVETEKWEAMVEEENSPDDGDSEERETLEIRESEDSANSNNRSKKKKKKKKKNGDGQRHPLSDKMPPSEATGGNEAQKDDPLVIALLGMGFTADQVSAAIKACGGVDRATADDLVVWILGEGSEDLAASPAASNSTATPDTTSTASPSATPNVAATLQHMANEALDSRATIPACPPGHSGQPQENEVAPEAKSRDKTTKVDTGKKEAETKTATDKLAAKREEKRRRNREWNNRAEARQKEEENAKVAQALAEANRAKQRAALEQQIQQRQIQMANIPSQPFSAQQPQSLHVGMAIPPGSGIMPLQQNPYPSYTGGRGMTASPAGNYNMQMPLPPGDSISHRQGTPGVNSNIIAAYQPNTIPDYDGNNLGCPPSLPGISQMASRWEPPRNHGALYGNDVSSQYASIPDDSTVSSYGSGRISARSTYSTNIPPGFRGTSASSTLPPQAEESHSPTYDVSGNLLGEMRATAREFVPSFGGSRNGSSRSSSVPALRHASSLQGAPVSLSSSARSNSETLGLSRLHTYSDSDVTQAPASSGSSDIHQNRILGGTNNFGTSLLASASSSYDRLATVTPSSEMSPVPPSAASSVTGVTHMEENQMPMNFGNMETSTAHRSSNVRDTIPPGLASSAFCGTGSGASIWGGLDSGGASGDNAGSLGGVALAGLPSFPLASKISTTGSIEPHSDGNGTVENPNMNGGIGGFGGWRSSGLGGGNVGPGGSIW